MSKKRERTLLPWKTKLLIGIFAVALGACNMILDNKPGELARIGDGDGDSGGGRGNGNGDGDSGGGMGDGDGDVVSRCDEQVEVCAPLLLDLVVTDGTLEPSFNAGVFEYQLAVPLNAQTIKITPTAPAGASVTLNGDSAESGQPWTTPTLALGENVFEIIVSQDDHPSSSYVLTITRGNQEAYLKASNTDEGNNFGHSVSLSADGNTLAVGTIFEGSAARGVNGKQSDKTALSAGAVYVFTRTGSTWSQQAYVKASNTAEGDNFGGSVSLSADGSTLTVGANQEDSAARGVNGNQSDNTTSDSGAVYVFTRTGSTWSQQAYLKASNTDKFDSFGQSVSLSADGNTLAVGAQGEASAAPGVNGNQSDNTAFSSGAVYVFTRTGSTWSQQAYLKASHTGGGDLFGQSVSLAANGNTLAVGAAGESSAAMGVNGNQSNNSAFYSGAGYVFTRTGSTWSQQAYVKASNTEEGDNFGYPVSLSADGNTLAVGAERESSAAMGVNGNQSNNSGYNSGAAYVFTRTGSMWSQQAYVKASNTDKLDSFGRSVALSADGNTLAVGAYGEDSAVLGNQSDNSASHSGAVYVFRRMSSSWSQQAYVKASNTGEDDWFGQSVSLSGDGSTLAVGAPGEASADTGVDADQLDNSAERSGAVYVFR